MIHLQTFLLKIFLKIVVVPQYLWTLIWEPRLLSSPACLNKYFTIDEREADSQTQLDTSFRAVPGPKRLLVVIPFKDKWALTKVCLVGLAGQNCQGLEVHTVLVDNGSCEQESILGTQDWLSRSTAHHVLKIDEPFNFSLLNNRAVDSCRSLNPDFVLLMNNDIELFDPDTLGKLFEVWQRHQNVGVVGATLLYPGMQKVQHLFVLPGQKIVGAHPFKGFGYQPADPWFRSAHQVPAVTGALMLIPLSVYLQLDGLDENLPTAYQDVDFCLKVRAAGFKCLVASHVACVHHETQTKRHNIAWNEVVLFMARWGWPKCVDSFPSISMWSERPLLRLFKFPYPLRWVVSLNTRKRQI